MSSVIEVPDWTRPVSVMGKDSEGNPVTVLLDSLGRLICVLYGAITLSGPIDVTQVDSTREIQGADGVTLHTIAVDSEGRIIAIVKGEYAGTLKNLAVDSEGRMIMIPTDPADIWGNAISMGNAELAAVLSPAKRFDRRGNVIFIDSFEEGLVHWEGGSVATGGYLRLSSDEANTGALSIRLEAGSDGDHYAFISRKMAYTQLVKYGLECAMKIRDYCEYFILRLYRYDGTNYHRFEIRYDDTLNILEVLKSDGTYATIIASIELATDYAHFNRFKMVADLSTDKYVRCLVNEQEVDLSAYSAKTLADDEIPLIRASIQYSGLAGHHGGCWVDDVIVTINEPA